MSEYREPPEGWATFGTHAYRDVMLEFSKELDEGGMPLFERPRRDMWDVALQVTDEVMGEGTYARLHAGSQNPRVVAAIERAASRPPKVVAGGDCALCGRSPAAGYASMWSPNTGEKWYCHGDDDPDPSCYMKAPIVMDLMVDLDRGRPDAR